MVACFCLLFVSRNMREKARRSVRSLTACCRRRPPCTPSTLFGTVEAFFVSCRFFFTVFFFCCVIFVTGVMMCLGFWVMRLGPGWARLPKCQVSQSVIQSSRRSLNGTGCGVQLDEAFFFFFAVSGGAFVPPPIYVVVGCFLLLLLLCIIYDIHVSFYFLPFQGCFLLVKTLLFSIFCYDTYH